MASNGQRGGTADLLWLNMLEHGCSWFKNHIYYHFVQIWVKYYIKCQQLFQSEFPLKCVSGCKYAYDVCWRGLLVTCLTDLGSPFLTGFNLEVKGFFLFYYKQMCVNSFEGAPDSMNTVIQLWYWLWEFQHQGQWQNSMCVCVCVLLWLCTHSDINLYVWDCEWCWGCRSRQSLRLRWAWNESGNSDDPWELLKTDHKEWQGFLSRYSQQPPPPPAPCVCFHEADAVPFHPSSHSCSHFVAAPFLHSNAQ